MGCGCCSADGVGQREAGARVALGAPQGCSMPEAVLSKPLQGA